jgi:hypothetical protein
MNRAMQWTTGLLAVTAALSAHPAGTPPGPMPPARVDLQGIAPHATRLGHADLVFRPGGTDVVVWIAPVNGLTRPQHLYTYVHQGSCANLGQRASEAPRRVLGYRETASLWTVRNTINLNADTLKTSPHALTVWSSPPDGNLMLYCGDLHLGVV